MGKYLRTSSDLDFLRKKTAERDEVARRRVLYYVLDDGANDVDPMTREVIASDPALKDPVSIPARIAQVRNDSRTSEGGFKTDYVPTLVVSVQTFRNAGIIPKPRDEIDDGQGVRYRVLDSFKDGYLTNTEHNLELKIPLSRIERSSNEFEQPMVTKQDDE